MKISLLLLGTLCVLCSAAQNKNPHLVLQKKKNVFAEVLSESAKLKKEKTLLGLSQQKSITDSFKPSDSLPKAKGFKLPNGNYVVAEKPGDMPCIIPDMSEYPNFRGVHAYQYKGPDRIPNVREK